MSNKTEQIATEPDGQGTITVAISTLGERAHRIALPAPVTGISYLVLVQAAPTALPSFDRADVEICPIEGCGLSASRNAAIERCKTDYLLFSDDDLILRPEGIIALGRLLDTDQSLGLVAGWRAAQASPPAARPLKWYTAGHICAPEFMVRMRSLREAIVRFDTEFGVGARYPIGEDYIFVCDLLALGVSGRNIPEIIGEHIGPSSGADWTDPSLIQARKAMLARVFGLWAPLVRCLYAVKHRRNLGGFRKMLAFALKK